MAPDEKKIRKSLRTLGKALRNAARSTTTEHVHALRISSRQVKTEMKALGLHRRRPAQRLLLELKPICRQAGKVRDLDVLLGLLPQLVSGGDEDCLLQLTRHLRAKRRKKARKLGDLLKDRAAAAERECGRGERLLRQGNDGAALSSKTAMAARAAMEELSAWPRLAQANLHPFRLKVKELRCLLETMEGADDYLYRSLGEVKDAIGAWHDWSVLAELVKKVLGAQGDRTVAQVRAKKSAALRHALRLSENMRREHLNAGPTKISTAASR